MPSQQTKFKNPYLKVIKGRIVPACEIEKRQQKLAAKQQQHQQQRCNRLNGWLDHKFQNFSYYILDCFDKRKHHNYNSSQNSSKLNDSCDSWDMNTSFSSNTTLNVINLNNDHLTNSNLNMKDILDKNMHHHKSKHHRNLDDNLSIVGDLFIFSCSSSMNTYETAATDHGYFSLDGSINTNYLKPANDSSNINNNNKKTTQSYNLFHQHSNKMISNNKKKIKSMSNLSKKVKFNLLHSMTSSSSFTNPQAPHRHSINHVSIIENEYDKYKNLIVDQQHNHAANDTDDQNTKITFAYLFGDLNLFASIDDEDNQQDIDSCLMLDNDGEECENCCANSSDAHSFTIDFSSVINSEEDDALSYDITSL